MSLKFLSFRRDPLKSFDFADKAKWQDVGGGSFKLLKPDMKKDRMFAAGTVKALKQVDPSERLYISGIANANIVDRMQERLDPRGIEVADYLKNAQLLAHHSYYHPVGQVEQLEIQEDGVHFRGWIGDPVKGELTEMQKEVRSLVSQGILKTVSVGFIPKKVRAPLFDDQGNMTEPCVIESWELLELSVVSVPCNQDSVFEMRGYQNENASATVDGSKSQVKDIFSQMASEDLEVQALIFSDANFTEESAIAWARDNDFLFDKIEETEDSWKLKQKDPNEFEPDSFRTIDITEGVKAVAGKVKDATDNAGDNYQQESLTMLRTISEGIKGLTEVCGNMMKKMEEPKKPEDEKPEPKPEDEKPKPEDEEAKAISARVEKLEKSFDKVVKALEVLAGKIK